MDRFALAQTMKEVTRRTDACWRPADIIQHQFAGAPFGSAYVCISPGEQSTLHRTTTGCICAVPSQDSKPME
jgi:hypothetical protein